VNRGAYRHLVDRLAERDAAHGAPVQQEERDVLHAPLVDVFAATVRRSATGALVTHVFVPRST